MSRQGTRIAAAAISGLALGVLAILPAIAAGKPGDLIVGDSGASEVLRVKPDGAVSTISSDPDLNGPAGPTFSAQGALYVPDYSAFSGAGAIFEVDLGSGAAEALVESDADLPQPVFVDYHPNGFLYSADFQTRQVLRINRNTGAVLPIAEDIDVFGIVALPGGDLVASSVNLAVPEFVRVTPGGEVTPIDLTGDAVADPYGLSVDARGRVLVAEYEGDRVLRLNPRTGRAKEVAQGDLLTDPFQAVELKSGKLAVANGDDGVVLVNPRTGGQSQLVAPDDFNFTEGLVVEPPRCKGRRANIVGTKRDDRLRGSRFPDVIAGFSGDDTIKGLGDNDRLCGGAGEDKLRGGPGRDRLGGGSGRDDERQ